MQSQSGPGGLAISAYANIPTSWDGKTGENILWKTPVPLPGENSPVVWGDRIFLTGFADKILETYCIDRKNGAVVWKKTIPVEKLRRISPLKRITNLEQEQENGFRRNESNG